jgi:hypothetical protein
VGTATGQHLSLPSGSSMGFDAPIDLRDIQVKNLNAGSNATLSIMAIVYEGQGGCGGC